MENVNLFIKTENKNNRSSIIVFAIGEYPTSHKESKIEMVLLVSTNSAKRNN
ncbi:14833_t:CDS:2 [Dentiscutata erythropus]|uniref:14833_t:CDS:1 n=1 Tax=Dentiscutata erythropus TaxID=1348616 RepID=A0A9N9A146_9GLOM|nr:14833_t:CDS:2 [Dentiscutata erythropus]